MSAKTDLEQAASEAVTVISQAANEAAKVVATAASEALKAQLLKNNDDHDILIELRTKLEGLKNDIRDLKDGTATQLADHERRLVELEKSKSSSAVTQAGIVALLGILATALIYHIVK